MFLLGVSEVHDFSSTLTSSNHRRTVCWMQYFPIPLALSSLGESANQLLLQYLDSTCSVIFLQLDTYIYIYTNDYTPLLLKPCQTRFVAVVSSTSTEFQANGSNMDSPKSSSSDEDESESRAS